MSQISKHFNICATIIAIIYVVRGYFWFFEDLSSFGGYGGITFLAYIIIAISMLCLKIDKVVVVAFFLLIIREIRAFFAAHSFGAIYEVILALSFLLLIIWIFSIEKDKSKIIYFHIPIYVNIIAFIGSIVRGIYIYYIKDTIFGTPTIAEFIDEELFSCETGLFYNVCLFCCITLYFKNKYVTQLNKSVL